LSGKSAKWRPRGGEIIELRNPALLVGTWISARVRCLPLAGETEPAGLHWIYRAVHDNREKSEASLYGTPQTSEICDISSRRESLGPTAGAV
jgi:hypothetical protein